MIIKNPSTGETLAEIPEDLPGAIEAKFITARTTQPAWAKLHLNDRLACLQRFHDLIEQQTEPLAALLTREVGKPIQESINELNGARNRIRFFLTESATTLAPRFMGNRGNTDETLAFDPLGVIANISAWNYPWLVGVNVFVPALISGNAVLYKPSEFATLTGLEIARLLKSAGVPEGVFLPILGSATAGEALLELPLDGYFFTGSYRTGKHIAIRVAEKLVPVGLELGGKDALYVTEDLADLNAVASSVAEGCFYNNGQSCCAVERVYVHEKIYESFVLALSAEAKKLKVGDPGDPANQQGAITRPTHIAFLESQLKDALSKGARLEAGGQPIPGGGSFFEPTVLSNVDHSMKVMSEETFGPIIGVMKVANDAEAVRLMNDSEYGLTASVYSRDLERAKSLAQQINVGTSYINCCDRVSPYLPWAGRNHSGLGTTLSFLGILAFVRPRGWHVRIPPQMA